MRKIVVVLVIAAMLLFAVMPAMAADLPGDEPAAAVPEAPVPDDAEAEAPADSQLTEVPEETAPPADETLGDIQEVAAEEATADLMAFTAEIKGAEQPIVAPAPASLDLYVNGAPATEGSGYTFEWMTTDINGNWVALDSGDMKGPEVGAKVVFDSTYPLLDGMKVKCVVTNAASEIVETQPVELSVKREHTVLTVNNQPVMPGGATADGSISLNADGTVLTINNANVTLDNARWKSAAVYAEPVDTDFTVMINGVSNLVSDFNYPDDAEPDIRYGLGMQIIAETDKTVKITSENSGDLNATGGIAGIDIGRRTADGKANVIIEGGVFLNTESTNPVAVQNSGAAFSAFTDVEILNGLLAAKTKDANAVEINAVDKGLVLGNYGAIIAESNSTTKIIGAGTNVIKVAPALTLDGGYINARMANASNHLNYGVRVDGDLKMFDGAELGVYMNSASGTVKGVVAQNIVNDSGSIRSTVKTGGQGATAISASKDMDAVDVSYTYGNATAAKDSCGIYVGTDKKTDTLNVNMSTVRGISKNTKKSGIDAGIISGKININQSNGGLRYGKVIGESSNGAAILSLVNPDSTTKQNYKANYTPKALKIAKGTKIITPKKVGEISTYSIADTTTKGHYRVYETVYGVGKNAVLQNRVVIG